MASKRMPSFLFLKYVSTRQNRRNHDNQGQEQEYRDQAVTTQSAELQKGYQKSKNAKQKQENFKYKTK